MTSATKQKWTLEQLQKHLRFAAELEFWTIPYYISALFSVQDPNNSTYPYFNVKKNEYDQDPIAKLILSVAVEEMFHFQCACNIANAFGAFDESTGFKGFTIPKYKGNTVPHINFALDHPDPSKKPVKYPPDDPNAKEYDFTQHTSKLGPLDQSRINTMCLIEYPNWKKEENKEFKPDATEYSSIGHFYKALLYGIECNQEHIQAKNNQQEISRTPAKKPIHEFSNEPNSDFKNFKYPQMPSLMVTKEGEEGLKQIQQLIYFITYQGEGRQKQIDEIPEPYRNKGKYEFTLGTSKSHFEKFLLLHDATPCNLTPKPLPPRPGKEDIEKEIHTPLKKFIERVNLIFVKGKASEKDDVDQPDSLMTTLGKSIAECYVHRGVNT